MTCNKCDPPDRSLDRLGVLGATLDRPRIVVLGMPNTGKSTFFNRLTGANASVGNWPGITVDLMTAMVKRDRIRPKWLICQEFMICGVSRKTKPWYDVFWRQHRLTYW